MQESQTGSEKPENPEAKHQLINARWNKPFILPIITLPESLPVQGRGGTLYIPVAVFDLEITGYQDKIITGGVSVKADSTVSVDPFTVAVSQSHTAINKELIQPAGNVSIEYDIVQDELGRPSMQARKLPLVVSVTTNPLSIFIRDIQRIKHFLTYKETVLHGNSGRLDQDITETKYNKWGGVWHGNNPVDNALMYLPYDPTIFNELQIIIGDAPPKK